jgi:beta-glucosidase
MAGLSNADAIVFVGGISPFLEGEEGDAGKEKLEGFIGGDRTTINLPTIQTGLMKQLKKLGKPLIFVNMSGSAMGMLWESENADAIIQAWYGGQSAGTAIAEVLFGDYNPSGRLPLTFYQSDNDLAHFEDYSMENRTYRYFKGIPLYSFGHGLSFSTFKYSSLKIPSKLKDNKKVIPVKFTIKNTSNREGAEVVQLYVTNLSKTENVAIKELKHFQRVNLKAGESKTVELKLNASLLGNYDDTGQLLAPSGKYEIQIGASSTDIKLRKTLLTTK